MLHNGVIVKKEKNVTYVRTQTCTLPHLLCFAPYSKEEFFWYYILQQRESDIFTSPHPFSHINSVGLNTGPLLN